VRPEDAPVEQFALEAREEGLAHRVFVRVAERTPRNRVTSKARDVEDSEVLRYWKKAQDRFEKVFRVQEAGDFRTLLTTIALDASLGEFN
jgi:hypothetical protein